MLDVLPNNQFPEDSLDYCCDVGCGVDGQAMTARKKRKRWRRKFWELDAKRDGVGGATYTKPKRRKQDRRAKSCEGYAVIFFPKITGLWRARVDMMSLAETFSQSPNAAKVKFLDSIAKGCTWAEYARAGHRIRKVRITDMGDA